MTTATKVDDFLVLCEGVRRLCGLDLTQYKRAQMERRVRTFVGRRDHDPDLGKYLGVLRTRPDELDAFLDRVTINVSELWRHPDQWVVLAQHVLPELAVAGPVRIWSAGASYGAEAYTIAAVCLEAIPRAKVSITGTDIDRRMIARARQGVFSDADARGVAKATMERHFERDGDGWRAKPALRALVRFEQGDLLRVAPKPGSYDLILCRNTAIYFSEEVRDDLHARQAAALRPGGVLMVGATERVADPRSMGLSPIHPFTYRKA
jgi:chemotaxis protein methyltransferase CheR